MNATLSLSECLLTMAREMADQGRTRDAIKLFERLIRFRDLPAKVVEEAHQRVADLFIAANQFKKARRHLSVLMCLKPSKPKPYYLYAIALHRDPKGNPHRAAKYYQQALDLDPANARWWSAYGKILVEIGKTSEAVGALRHAFELDNDDPVIIGRLVEALSLDDRVDEAQRLLRDERFRHPNDGRYRKLWNDFQFRQAAASQTTPTSDEPVLLSFIRKARVRRPIPSDQGIYRFDDAKPTVTPPRVRRSVGLD